MDVIQMHIELDQALQKLGSAVSRKPLPEEYDLQLNKAMYRFIRKCLVEKDNGAFSVLETDRAFLDPIIKSVATPIRKQSANFIKTVLPSDMRYLLEDSSAVLCNVDTVVAVVEYVHTLEYSSLTVGDGVWLSVPGGGLVLDFSSRNLIVDKVDGVGTTTVFDSSLYVAPIYWSDADLKFFMVDLVLEKMRASGIEVYWEYYNGNFYQDKFVFRTSVVNTVYRYTHYVPGTLPNTYVGTLINSVLIQTNPYSKRTVTGAEIVYANRLIRNDGKNKVLRTPFHGPVQGSPISVAMKGELEVYSYKSDIVNELRITYVRNPQKISVISGSGCELSDDACYRIIDFAVEQIMTITGNTLVQAKVQEDEFRGK